MSLYRLALASLCLLACSPGNAPADGGNLDVVAAPDAPGNTFCANLAALVARCSPTSSSCSMADSQAQCQWLMSFDHRGVIANAYASCLTQLFSGPSCPSGSLPGLTSCVENTLATANPEQAVLDGLSAVCTQCSELRGGGSPDDCVHALVHNGLTSGADPQAIVNLWGVTGADATAMRSCLAAAPTSGSCGMATNRCIYPTTTAPASTCRDN